MRTDFSAGNPHADVPSDLSAASTRPGDYRCDVTSGPKRKGRTPAVVVGALALLAAVLVWRGCRAPTEPTGAAVAPAAAPLAQSRPAETPAAGADGSLRGGKARLRVPKLITAPSAQVAGDGGVAPRAAPVARLAKGGGLPANRLGKTPARMQELQLRVRDLLGQMEQRAEACLASWATEDESLKQGLMLAIDIDEMGLQDVWFVDRTEVPSGPLACISNAVYALDWSGLAGLAEQSVMLTTKIRYESADAGGAR
jgi:hypothetical protein